MIDLLIVASMTLLLIGLLWPEKSLFWYSGNRNRKFSLVLYATIFLLATSLRGCQDQPVKKTTPKGLARAETILK